MNGPRYHLEIEPVSGNWRAHPEKRLTRSLKTMLRAHGLRCAFCRPRPAQPPQAEAEKAGH